MSRAADVVGPPSSAVCYRGAVLSDAAFCELVLRLMIRMTRVDGSVDDDELVRVRWVLQRMFGDSPSEDELRIRIDERLTKPLRLDEVLREAVEHGSASQKRQLMKVAFVIATADGQVVDLEDSLLRRTAKALGIAPKAYAEMCSHTMIARDFL